MSAHNNRKFVKLILMYEEQKGVCYYCLTSLLEECKLNRSPQVDHKQPRSKGGNNSKENLCLTCKHCNASKNNKTEQEFVDYLKPYLENKIEKKDLAEYYKYQLLTKKFKNI